MRDVRTANRQVMRCQGRCGANQGLLRRSRISGSAGMAFPPVVAYAVPGQLAAPSYMAIFAGRDGNQLMLHSRYAPY
jgi:hypothetical protein